MNGDFSSILLIITTIPNSTHPENSPFTETVSIVQDEFSYPSLPTSSYE
jgi:hypothetical protein